MPTEFETLTKAYVTSLAKKKANKPLWYGFDTKYGSPVGSYEDPFVVSDPEPAETRRSARLSKLTEYIFSEKDLEALRSHALEALRVATNADREAEKFRQENIDILNRLNEPEGDI